MLVKVWWQRGKLIVPFGHASTCHRYQSSLMVSFSYNGITTVGEGCPRDFFQSQKPADLENYYSSLWQQWQQLGADLVGLQQLSVQEHYPAYFCAFELAVLARLQRLKNHEMPDRIISLAPMTGVLPLTSKMKQKSLLWLYQLCGLRQLKYKIVQGSILALPDQVSNWSVRLDANNGFTSARQCISEVRKVAPHQVIDYIEEPVAIADYAQIKNVAEALQCKVILDESITRQTDLALLNPKLHVLNIRISKLGGYLASQKLILAAKAQGFQMILGCHVAESDILTQAGIRLWHWGKSQGVNWLSNELGLNAWLCGDWKSSYKLAPWRRNLSTQMWDF